MKQIIVCAAVKVNSLIICGARHFDAAMSAVIDAVNEPCSGANMEQGFIDQRGNFFDRRDAWVIAESAEQIKRRVGDDGVLYSENLY